MNMISTGSFLTETGASNKQSELVKKLTAAWEKKNSKTARAGGASLMALSLAACGGEDNTPFSQADVDAAKAEGVASVDIKSDNDAAMISNDADIAAAAKTEALTAADGTIYATVDAAYTAGSNVSNADAVTAALTAADGTVYATVDAAVTAGEDGVDITTDNAQAVTDALAGTGFSTVADLNAAYLAASAATPALSEALTSSADVVNGTVANDALTATSATYGAGDLIVDSSSTDSDTLVITAINDITATATIAGIENITFNLDAVAAATANATAFDVAIDNIANGTVTVAVTKAGSPIDAAIVTGVGTGVNVASALTTVTVTGDANGDHTINLTGAAAQTLTQNGDTDTLVVNAGSVTISDANADESITVNATGSVTVTDITPTATTLNSLDINAGGAISIADLRTGGHVDAATTSGNVTVATANKADVANDNLTASTDAGNVTVTNWTGTGTVTATASGNIADTATTNDGDVTITQTDATVVTVTATGDANIDDVAEATTLTLNVGQNSNVANTNDNIQFVTVSSTSASATPTIIEFADGDGAVNGTTDGMVELDTITFTGSNSVTVDLAGADLVLAAASTANTTTATKLIATDNMTGGTSRIDITASAGANTLDISGMAVDEVAIGYTLNANEAFTVASGQNIVITGDTTADLNISAGAVAGQTASIVFADDSAATTANDLGGITSSNLATVTVSSLDMAHSGAAAGAATGAVNVGAANTLAITGGGKVNVASITGAILDGSQATGKITVGALNGTTAFKGGEAGDSFTSGGDTDLNVDGNGGLDTLVLAAGVDYSNNTVTLADIEVLDVSASTVTLAGATMHNSSYVISADNGATDTLAVKATVSTGQIIDMSGTSSAAKVTMNGSNGADALTGSSTTGTFFDGGTGSDTIVGGDGVDNVTVDFEVSAADNITLGGGNDVVTTATTTAATISEFTVADFDLGTNLTAKDTMSFSITALKGLTTVTQLTDTSDNNSADTNGTVVHLSADGASVANADLVVLQNTYATEAAVVTGLSTAGGDTITYGAALDDNDAYLVAYTNGTNSYIAVATTGAGDLATSQGVDSVENIMVLAGVTDLSTLDSTDFSVIT